MGRSIRDGQHDFDFEIGTWTTHLRRLKSPLTGSTEWVEYDGTSVVRPIWDGRANLVELDVAGPARRNEGGHLPLPRPQSRQGRPPLWGSANGPPPAPAIRAVRGGPRGVYLAGGPH